MQPRHPAAAGPKPAARSKTLHYVVSLTLLVAIVGGIAWLAQYLPGKSKQIEPPAKVVAKKLLEFPAYDEPLRAAIAKWFNPRMIEKKTDAAKVPFYTFKDCEVGGTGQYDFLFKNVADEDVEIVSYTSTCDCTTVKACALSVQEFESLNASDAAKPGEPLPYLRQPDWLDLNADNARPGAAGAPNQRLRIKANEGGVVRVLWIARKSAGQDLNLAPVLRFQTVGETPRHDAMMLRLLVKVTVPVQFNPPRATTGVLTPGTTGRAEFDAWSSTREAFELKLSPIPADPLFEIATRPMSKAECAALEARLKKEEQISTHVLSAFHVTVTVHETKGDRQIEQGVFFRKLPVFLDGRPSDLAGPEIVGRVKGDVQVGGSDDQGKIRFPSFEVKYGASKTVQLSADAKIKLKEHIHPSWVEVKLRQKTTEPVDGRHIWEVEVTVPPDARDAHSFRDEDAVVLRFAGPKYRYVRIPLEGNITGGR